MTDNPPPPSGEHLIDADSCIYARVSTDEQAKRGFSIPSQLIACRAYAAHHGFVVALELSDDETGAILIRDNLTRLRDLLPTGQIKRVIVWRQDRLARDELTYFTLRAEFKRHNVELHVVNRGGQVDGLYASLEAVLDADERQRIAQRTARGRLDKAKRGKLVGYGPPPFGYLRSGEGEDISWAIDDRAAPTIRLIYQWYTSEQLSQAAIAARLTEQGTPTPSDLRPAVKRKRGPGQWNAETVRWILSNPTYTGVFYAYRTKQGRGDEPKKRPPVRLRPEAEWIPIAVPKIIEPDLFAAAQLRRAEAPALSFRNSKREYLAARHIRCSCGRAATATTSSQSGYNRQTYPYYSCNSKRQNKADRGSGPACAVPPFRGDAVDTVLWAWIRDELLNSERLRTGIAIYDAAKLAARAQQPDPLAEQAAKLESLIDQRARVNTAYIHGAMSFAEYDPHKRRLDRQIAEIERALQASGSSAPRPADRASRAAGLLMVETLIENYKDRLRDVSFDIKRFIVDRLRITVTLKIIDGTKHLGLRSETLDLETEKPL